MATKPISTAAIEKGTARSWQDWLAFLEEIGADRLSHKEIAERVAATGDASGWWSQSIAVAYEQRIGRRRPGQRSDGTYQASASRTIPGTRDEALVAWSALTGQRKGVRRGCGRARARDQRVGRLPLLALRARRRLARLDDIQRQGGRPRRDRPRP